MFSIAIACAQLDAKQNYQDLIIGIDKILSFNKGTMLIYNSQKFKELIETA
jgi:hypothetical protein